MFLLRATKHHLLPIPTNLVWHTIHAIFLFMCFSNPVTQRGPLSEYCIWTCILRTNKWQFLMNKTGMIKTVSIDTKFIRSVSSTDDYIFHGDTTIKWMGVLEKVSLWWFQHWGLRQRVRRHEAAKWRSLMWTGLILMHRSFHRLTVERAHQTIKLSVFGGHISIIYSSSCSMVSAL